MAKATIIIEDTDKGTVVCRVQTRKEGDWTAAQSMALEAVGYIHHRLQAGDVSLQKKVDGAWVETVIKKADLTKEG